MNLLIKHLFLFTFLFSISQVYGGVETVTDSKTGGSIVISATLTAQTTDYSCIIANSCTPSIGIYESRIHAKLKFKDTNRVIYGAWNISIDYDITLYDEAGNATVITGKKLDIDYDPTANYTDIDFDLYTGPKYIKAVLTIQGVNSGITIPSDVELSLVVETEKYTTMDVSLTPLLGAQSYNSTRAELNISWASIVGAESYDVEWLFIDIGDDTLNTYTYDFRNATRINSNQNNYTFSLAYPRGYLLFRARAVQTKNTVSGTERLEGNWTSEERGTISPGLGNYQYAQYSNWPICGPCPTYLPYLQAYYYHGLETGKNWQYSVTYAEQGKRKEAITYFDGTLRNRQQVTVLSTDTLAIVGETIYDYVGRPAVNTLPSVQSVNQGMHYYTDQNRSITSGLYSYTDFDKDANFDSPAIIDSVNSKGSAFYYSGQNSSPFGINSQYIPTAQGYSYTRVQYKNDGTNRVKKQSGVGKQFRIGSGKETVYLYGKPTQDEITRLFGNEVGYYSLYKKNAVVDPNGQASISYIDNSGRTIATALSGDTPDNLKHIDTRPGTWEEGQYEESFPEITSDLSLSNQLDQNGRMVAGQTLVVTSSTTYTFTYGLTSKEITNLCIGNRDCTFDIEIYITDEYGTKKDLGSGTEYTFTNVSSVTSFNFAVTLEVGTYQVHKIVSLNQAELQLSLDELEDSNACLSFTVDSVTRCNPTCEEMCRDAFVSVNAAGDTTYLDDNGDLVAVINTAGSIITYGSNYSTPALADPKIASIRLEIAECADSCEDFLVNQEFSPCEIKLQVLINDMSPGGQYFDSRGVADTNNGWLIANLGTSDPSTLSCLTDTSWDAVRENWSPAHAKKLVTLHPEWCAYEKECCVYADDCGDLSSVTTGICNAEILADSVALYTDNYLASGISITNISSSSYYTSNYPTGIARIDTILLLLHNPTTGVIATGIMTSTQFSQSIYDFYEGYIKYNNIKDNCEGLYLDGANGITSNGYIIRYPKNPIYEVYSYPVNLTAINNLRATNCDSSAREVARGFMANFGCIDTLSIAQQNELETYIHTTAKNNCIATGDPYTSSTTTLNADVVSYIQTKYGLTPTCMAGAWPKEEQENCECSNLFEFIASAQGKTIQQLFADPNLVNTASLLTVLTSLLDSTEIANGVSASNLPAWFTSCNDPLILNHGTTASSFPSYLTCDSGINQTFTNDSTGCINTLNQLAYYNAYNQMLVQVADSLAKYKQEYITSCFDNFPQRETFTVRYTLKEYHYTLYYYDQAGNLIKTVPPEGLYQLDKNGAEIHNSILDGAQIASAISYLQLGTGSYIQPAHVMATNYRYNSLNQLIAQYTPDGDSSHFYYDALGRLVASQNANQLSRTAYSYTQFDNLGRMTEVGEIDGASSSLTEVIARDTTEYLKGFTGINAFFGWLSTNSSQKKQIVKTYYDKQDITLLPTATLTQLNLRNRIASVTYDKDGNGTHESASHYTYDINGNVNTLLQENKNIDLSQKYKRLDYDYDLVSGNVNKVSYQKGEVDEFYHKYQYDSDNRLTIAYSSRNDVIWEKESKNLYYAHGPLARTELGDKEIQGLDYAYTLQGWLKVINSSMGHSQRDIGADGQLGTTNQEFAQDAYGFSLHYYQGDYKSIGSGVNPDVFAQFGTADKFGGQIVDLYNGNISAMIVGLTMQNEAKAKVIGNTYQYDQLNRLKNYTPFQYSEEEGDPVYDENNFEQGDSINSRYVTNYWYDGNGNIEKLNRKGSELVLNDPSDPSSGYYHAPVDMDNFNYIYDLSSGKKLDNKLYQVEDDVDPANYNDDLDNQDPDNYAYDKIGRLTKDDKEGISSISWNVANKIVEIQKATGQIISFTYDPMGNRISKTDDNGAGIVTTTFYARDAQGNVMATYKNTDDGRDVILKLNDFHIYGSSRLGTKQEDITLVLNGTDVSSGVDYSFRKLGEKRYELSNHLGNVLEVVSDRKLAVDDGGGNIAYWTADVVSYSDYYPFGMLMPNRHGQSDDYRYGWNGAEKDDEIRGTKGASYDLGARMYDPRIGRMLSVDPWTDKYSWQSPYVYHKNSPIASIDWKGFGDDPKTTSHTLKGGESLWSVAADKLGEGASNKDIAKLKNQMYKWNNLNSETAKNLKIGRVIITSKPKGMGNKKLLANPCILLNGKKPGPASVPGLDKSKTSWDNDVFEEPFNEALDEITGPHVVEQTGKPIGKWKDNQNELKWSWAYGQNLGSGQSVGIDDGSLKYEPIESKPVVTQYSTKYPYEISNISFTTRDGKYIRTRVVSASKVLTITYTHIEYRLGTRFEINSTDTTYTNTKTGVKIKK